MMSLGVLEYCAFLRIAPRNASQLARCASLALKSVLPNSISTIRKDRKGHKDRRILTEANEANERVCRMLSQIRTDNPFLTLVDFCKIFSVFVIFPYCELRF